MHHKTPRDFSSDEMVEAAAGAFRASFTPTARADLHPLSRAILDSGPMGLGDFAQEILLLRRGAAAVDDRSPTRNITNALAVSDFPPAVLDAARSIVRTRRSTLLADLLSITTPVEVSTFAAEGFAIADVGELPMPSRSTGDKFHAIIPTLTGEPVTAWTTPARLVVSEQSLMADDIGLVRAIINGYADSCHRAEWAHLAEMLEKNPNLSDGEPVFDAGKDTLHVGTLTADYFVDAATKLLRKQKTASGSPAAAQLAALLCHPDSEYALLKVIENNLPPERRPRVIGCPWLSDASSIYAFADQSICPSVARVRLRGSDPSAIAFGGLGPAVWLDDDGRTREAPGIVIEGAHSVGLQFVSRIGLVQLKTQ